MTNRRIRNHRLLPACIARTASRRRGVSVMEVLISIFVLLFGLLGIAALLPVGRYELAEASKRDRAAVVGRAVLRDLQIRGLIHPQRWAAWYDATLPAPGYMAAGSQNKWWCVAGAEPMLNGYMAYAIDPLRITQSLKGNANLSKALATFPANALPGEACLGRVCWIPQGWNVALDQEVPVIQDAAKLYDYSMRLNVWRDDLLFQIPDDKTLRPYAVVRHAGGAVNDSPTLLADPVLPETEGLYSWMATVSPAMSEFGLPFQGRNTYNVSVAVFHNRDLSPPGQLRDERPNEILTAVGFLGGSEVDFNVGTDVRKGDWVCVIGTTGWGRICQWYRIVSVFAPGSGRPRATLAGPDWHGTPAASAVVVPGVVAVYTETVSIK